VFSQFGFYLALAVRRQGELVLNVVGFSEYFTLMSERVEVIMNMRRKINTSISLKTLLALLVIGPISIPAYGVNQKPATEDNLLATDQNPGFVLTGTVKDKATGEPIAGAIVSDDNYGPKPYKQATTDSTGKYSYATWGEEHNVIAQAPNYRPERKTLITDLFQLKKQGALDFELTRERSLVEMKIKFGEKTSVDTDIVVENGKPAVITIGDLKIEDTLTKDAGGRFLLKMKLSLKNKEGGFKITSLPSLILTPGINETQIETMNDDGTPFYSISIKATDVK